MTRYPLIRLTTGVHIGDMLTNQVDTSATFRRARFPGTGTIERNLERISDFRRRHPLKKNAVVYDSAESAPAD